MKLRYKKTGEVFDAFIREKGGGGSYSLIVCDIKAYEQRKNTLDGTHFVLEEYDSLAKLNDDWEDYKPTEPLIKDEKTRKAVRAWCEANNLFGASYYKSSHYWYLRSFNDHGQAIDFWLRYGDEPEMKENKCYTVTELCGEEE